MRLCEVLYGSPKEYSISLSTRNNKKETLFFCFVSFPKNFQLFSNPAAFLSGRLFVY